MEWAILSLLALGVTVALTGFVIWRLRDNGPSVREAKLADQVSQLSDEVQRLRATVNTLTLTLTDYRNQIDHAVAQNRDLMERLAALTGNTSGSGITPKLRAVLRRALTERLSGSELATLAVDCGTSIDDLGGETQEMRALNLIQYMDQRQRIGDLLYTLRQMRADIKLDIL